MKKFILMIVALFAMATANAQVTGNKPFDNVFVGVQGGITTPLDFYDVTPFNYTAGLRLGKNITPVVGVIVEDNVIFGPYNVGNGMTGNWFSSTAVKGNNLSLLGTFNFMNAIGGYKGQPRFFETSLVAGLGWLHFYGNNPAVDYTNDLSARTAVNLAFNLGEAKAWAVYVEPNINWNLTAKGTGAVQFNKHFAQLGIQVGAVYKFKTSNGTHNFVKARLWDQAAIDKLNARIAELEARKPEVVEKIVEKQVTVAEVQKVADEASVFFAFDSAELTDAAKARLDKLPTDTEVTVTGYASCEGAKTYNQKLSERRAKAVADYLEARGVKVKEVVGKGIATRELNRCVTVK